MDNKILKISTQTGDLFNECTTDYEYLYKCFSHLKECGFEAIDYNMDHFLPGNIIVKDQLNDFWDKSLEELYEYFTPTKKAMEDSGLVFSQTHSSFPVYVDGNDKVNDYMVMVVEKSLAVCAFLRCPALVVHPFRCKDFAKENAVNLEMYRKMMPAAKKYGVIICLENSYADMYADSILIDKLNEEAGAKCFGYCLDIGHANCGGGEFYKYITILGDRLTCLHIHDNDGANDSHMIPYTQTRGWNINRTNYDAMLEALRDINYQGNLSFESFRGMQALPKEVESEALRLLSAIGRYFRDRILNG
ncbi:MAG: sugar phosphate isomerase/epimerase [Clostridia bacterium]|nr:sugar phosphate isomerase/epimerase [Clostridia bacterium]MBQ8552545.1 sugar phosphate isomerase/epimerase [Clostridia bacterium]